MISIFLLETDVKRSLDSWYLGQIEKLLLTIEVDVTASCLARRLMAWISG